VTSSSSTVWTPGPGAGNQGTGDGVECGGRDSVQLAVQRGRRRADGERAQDLARVIWRGCGADLAGDDVARADHAASWPLSDSACRVAASVTAVSTRRSSGSAGSAQRPMTSPGGTRGGERCAAESDRLEDQAASPRGAAGPASAASPRSPPARSRAPNSASRSNHAASRRTSTNPKTQPQAPYAPPCHASSN